MWALFVIFHARIDGAGTVNLLRQNQPGQLVGHGYAAHGKPDIGRAFDLLGKAVGGTDDKGDIPRPAVGALCKQGGQLLAGKLFSFNDYSGTLVLWWSWVGCF